MFQLLCCSFADIWRAIGPNMKTDVNHKTAHFLCTVIVAQPSFGDTAIRYVLSVLALRRFLQTNCLVSEICERTDRQTNSQTDEIVTISYRSSHFDSTLHKNVLIGEVTLHIRWIMRINECFS